MESVTETAGAERARLPRSDFAFELPLELIAQEPAPTRTAARLLVWDRSTGAIAHRRVAELPAFVRAGDVVVFNDTKVIPARLYGRTTSGAGVELLVIRRHPLPEESVDKVYTALASGSPPLEKEGQGGFAGVCFKPEAHKSPSIPLFQRGRPVDLDAIVGAQHAAPLRRSEATAWECLGRPGRRLHAGATLRFGETTARVESASDGRYLVAFDTDDVPVLLARHGEVPLPPYIKRPDGPLPFDRERYQTVFAAHPGAVAAPTAGLHFTPELIESLRRAGAEIAHLTLHVGPGTFLPVRTDDLSQHVMEPEWCEIPPATAALINDAHGTGRRVVAVGTTTTRALESAVDAGGVVQSGTRWADCFIRPGHRFRVIDALFTNFHLPGSTLLALVSAFAGRDYTQSVYAEAVKQRYRFYSYGDAMFIQ